MNNAEHAGGLDTRVHNRRTGDLLVAGVSSNAPTIAPPARPLSCCEKQVLTMLRRIKRESIWNDGIREAVRHSDPDKFRQLIEQLQSQAKDNAVTMLKILGEKAFIAVMELIVPSRPKVPGLFRNAGTTPGKNTNG